MHRCGHIVSQAPALTPLLNPGWVHPGRLSLPGNRPGAGFFQGSCILVAMALRLGKKYAATWSETAAWLHCNPVTAPCSMPRCSFGAGRSNDLYFSLQKVSLGTHPKRKLVWESSRSDYAYLIINPGPLSVPPSLRTVVCRRRSFLNVNSVPYAGLGKLGRTGHALDQALRPTNAYEKNNPANTRGYSDPLSHRWFGKAGL